MWIVCVKHQAWSWRMEGTRCYFRGRQNPSCSTLERGHGSAWNWQKGRAQGQKIWRCIRICLATYLEAATSILVPFPETQGLGLLQGHLSFPSALPSGLVLLHCPHQVSGSTPCSNPFIRKPCPDSYTLRTLPTWSLAGTGSCVLSWTYSCTVNVNTFFLQG